MNPTFTFTAELWPYPKGNWVFLTVPEDESDQINDLVPIKAGFGSVKVEVAIGNTRWRTSVFPDSKLGCYVLPVKKAVRAAEKLDIGDQPQVELTALIAGHA